MASLTLRLAISSTLLFFYQQSNNQSLRLDRDSVDKTPTTIVCTYILEPIAQYPGGLKAWQGFLKTHSKFTITSVKNAKPIHLSFSVSKEEELENIKIIRGNNPSHNKEAIRLLKLSSPWLPAMRNNIPEACSMFVRIVPQNY